MTEDNEINSPNEYSTELKEVLNFKKELIIKEYDSLFNVYGRKTTIIYHYRTWEITLLTALFIFSASNRFIKDYWLILGVGGFIIAGFLWLEIYQRKTMVKMKDN